MLERRLLTIDRTTIWRTGQGVRATTAYRAGSPAAHSPSRTCYDVPGASGGSSTAHGGCRVNKVLRYGARLAGPLLIRPVLRPPNGVR